MKHINHLPSYVKTVGEILDSAGFEARLVGGAVRDIMNGKKPKDYDMATTALPDTVMGIFNQRGFTVVPTGLQHGTVTVMVDFNPIEITTLRVDTNTDGRHAEVKFITNWEEDASRRDFTFNSMSMDMDGKLYDYFNGHDDLMNNRVRFVGNHQDRIKEDYLRIMRYFRFNGYLNSTPVWDDDVLDSILYCGNKLITISGERIWSELVKIVMSPHIISIMDKMIHYDVINSIIKTNNRNYSTNTNIFFGKDHVNYVCSMSKNPVTRICAALHPLMGMGQLLNVMIDRFKVDSASASLANLFLYDDPWNKVIEYYWKKHFIDKISIEYVRELAIFDKKFDIAVELDTTIIPVFPINGNDVMQFGYKNKQVGVILNALKAYWIDNKFNPTKEDLLNEDLIKELVK